MSTRVWRSSIAACVATIATFTLLHSPAHAAKTTECAKVGVCYCVNAELKSTIAGRVERFRQMIADQRKAGKAVGYLSVPLTSAGGGNFNVNKEVAESAKAAIEKRYGADYLWILNPGTLEADLPKGTGADYMSMWATLLEGTDGLGDFDFVFFADPKLGTGNQIPMLFDGRAATPPESEAPVSEGYVGKCPL